MKSIEEIKNEIQNETTETPITEAQAYDDVIAKLTEAKENGTPLEEGLFGAITGGIIGATFGPAVMKAICKILGIDEKGQFGSLLTSRLVTTALGAAMGWK